MDQAFDRMMKGVTTRAARKLLDISGILPEDMPVELRSLEREVAGPALRTDQLFHYKDTADWTIHFEFEARWRGIMPARLMRYQKVITLEYPGAEVNSVVFVLRPESCPKAGAYTYREGSYSPIVEVKYRVVRVWELDPARILAGEDSELLPVAAIMSASDEEVIRIRRRVAHDPERTAQLAALLGIRYDKDQIERIFGDHPMFTKEILKHSWAVREVMEDSRAEGRVEGRAEGRNEGRVQEARELLKRRLRRRFPQAITPAQIDGISDLAALEAILDQVLDGSDHETILHAIGSAARPNA